MLSRQTRKWSDAEPAAVPHDCASPRVEVVKLNRFAQMKQHNTFGSWFHRCMFDAFPLKRKKSVHHQQYWHAHVDEFSSSDYAVLDSSTAVPAAKEVKNTNLANTVHTALTPNHQPWHSCSFDLLVPFCDKGQCVAPGLLQDLGSVAATLMLHTCSCCGAFTWWHRYCLWCGFSLHAKEQERTVNAGFFPIQWSYRARCTWSCALKQLVTVKTSYGLVFPSCIGVSHQLPIHQRNVALLGLALAETWVSETQEGTEWTMAEIFIARVSEENINVGF